MGDARAQAVTLEAVIASLVLLSSLIFALQMTAVTPLSASTSNQHIENQLQASAEGTLAMTTEDGSLERALLFYNESASVFIDAGQRGYYTGPPPENEFGDTLQWAFDDRGIAYNVYLEYDVGGTDRSRRMIYRGKPSDNAVSASTTVTLTDGSRLHNDSDDDGTAEPRPVTLREVDEADDEEFYASNQSASGLYNIVRVEVVVWRI